LTTEICKLFGGSTPDGVGYQFRAIKKGGDVLSQAADSGGDPVAAFAAHMNGGAVGAGSVPATPSQRTPSTAKRARSTKAAGPRSGATPTTKRRKKVEEELEPELEDDEDSSEVNYSDLDGSPTKHRPKMLTTPKKIGELLPHSAWAKPVSKTPVRGRNVPIAPAPPRPAPAQPYTMAPIPGLAVPNGYTDPATGLGYNAAPPSAMSATPSIANSPAMDMTTMRRGSTFSTGSFSSGSRPATPTLGYPPETSANTTTQGQQYHPAPSTVGMTASQTMSTTTGMGIGMVINTNVNPAPIEPNHNLSVANNNMTNMTNMPPFNTDPFNAATSPAPSVSDTHTPQTSASSNTVGSGMHTMADDIAHSFQAGQNSFGYGGYRTVSNGGRTQPSTGAGSMDYFAAGVDFGSFSDQEREEAAEAEEWDDAGDC
jgi:hypothetical protein